MNILDILLALPMGYFIWKGYKRGIIFEVAALAGIIVGCYVAIQCANLVSTMLPFEGEGTILIAFFILFVGVLLLSRVLGRALEGAVRLVHAGWINKAMGSLLGFAKAVCVLAVIIDFVMLVDMQQKILTPKVQESSMLFSPVHSVGKKMTAQLKIYAEKAKQEVDKRNGRSES